MLYAAFNLRRYHDREMNIRIASFEEQLRTSREIAPDFGALVALQAASQSAAPTARVAAMLESTIVAAMREGSERVAALIGLFAPRRGEASPGSALEARFNPAVPLSHASLTGQQPW